MMPLVAVGQKQRWGEGAKSPTCLQVESALLHVKSGDIFEFFRHAQRGRNHIKFLRN